MLATDNKSGRNWTDWIGFACFSAIAISLLVRAPQIALLLLPLFLHEALTAISFVIRRPLRQQLDGFTPRIAAYLGSFIIPVFAEFSRRFHPEWIAVSYSGSWGRLAFFTWLAGSLLGVWTVWKLRTAFSLVPQARELITTGPYSLARHPMYASYLLQYLAIWLACRTGPLAVAILLWLAVASVRMRLEERLLNEAFPEYSYYRIRVPALGIRVSRPKSPAQAILITQYQICVKGILGKQYQVKNEGGYR